MNEKILENREQIDKADEQIFDLLLERLDAVTTIGQIKKQEGLPVLDQERENVNDQFAKSLSIDLNDRLAFIKHLFNEDKINYERVISQIITFESWSEVSKFLDTQVKIEYNNWEGKEDYEERFMRLLAQFFETK